MWQYNKIVSQEIDLAGKHRVVVSVLDGTKDQWLMLKFQTEPKDTVVRTEAQKQLDLLNNPPPPEPTVADLKAIIVEKDTEIATLKAEKVVK